MCGFLPAIGGPAFMRLHHVRPLRQLWLSCLEAAPWSSGWHAQAWPACCVRQGSSRAEDDRGVSGPGATCGLEAMEPGALQRHQGIIVGHALSCCAGCCWCAGNLQHLGAGLGPGQVVVAARRRQQQCRAAALQLMTSSAPSRTSLVLSRWGPSACS